MKRPDGLTKSAYKSNEPGSSITNGREPRSCLGQVFKFTLGRSVSEKCNCRACTRPLLELKLDPGFVLLAEVCPWLS